MKKKIVSIALVAALAITALVGTTLAYFTDTDDATNTFTVGDVKIELKEKFEQNSKLFPGVDVNKDVWVKNTGSENAFVRVHIAFPAVLDSGDPEFAAYANTLHWNFAKASVADGQWNWHNTFVNGSNAEMPGYPGNGGAWNSYSQTIDGIDYTVYVVTYETALASGKETTTYALDKVYLDTSVTNEDVTGIKEVLGDNWEIKVVAEGVQEAGFEGKPYEALNTAFGVPGSYNPWATETAE